MSQETLLSRGVRGFNAGVVALAEAPIIGKLLGKAFAQISYTGRRSGRTFTTPVNYLRRGDEYVIGVAMPDKKKWWRNFLGEGGPVTLRIAGVDHPGHAVTHRDDGRVTVRVRLLAPA
ncbi:nitroreductase/quinone reductase family protein [Nocardia neocaledoniensis]|uniref:nitroreductase/quinone reductase family protein n=1 Tax=Nocardia neocaledoniensis TaxID=236511 RepID=UPI002456C959|nr:nitroreductase/quinone reductase family protein [Nocardia neocaledoniensis]